LSSDAEKKGREFFFPRERGGGRLRLSEEKRETLFCERGPAARGKFFPKKKK